MAADEDTIRKISQVLSSLPGRPSGVPEHLTEETTIVGDLKLDSLSVMDFVMALETRFDTIIPIDGIADVRTVGDLAALLQPALKQVPV